MEGPRGSWHWTRPSLEELRNKNIVTNELLKRGIDFVGKRSGVYDAWNEVKQGYQDFSSTAEAEYNRIKKGLKAAKKTSGLDQIPRKPGKRASLPTAPPNSPVGSQMSDPDDWRTNGGTSINPATFANLLAGATMSGHDDHEVKVVPPPRKIAKIHPDYFTVNLPYATRLSPIAVTSFTHTNTTPMFTIRLNSIYDPLKAIRSNLDFEGNPLIDPVANSDFQPQGRDIWAAHFKYYRVLSSQIKMTLVSDCVSTNGTAHPWFNNFVVGYELTDEDGQLSDEAESFLTTKRAKRGIIPSCDTISYYNGTSAAVRPVNVMTRTFTYNYNPKDWDFHVEEKGIEERWTLVSKNPDIDHELNFRAFHLQSNADPVGKFSVLIQINYEVQFREALDSFFKTRDDQVAVYDGSAQPISLAPTTDD